MDYKLVIKLASLALSVATGDFSFSNKKLQFRILFLYFNIIFELNKTEGEGCLFTAKYTLSQAKVNKLSFNNNEQYF